MCIYVSIRLSVWTCTRKGTYMCMFRQTDGYMCMFCRITVHFFFWISIFILLMLPRICAGSPKAMQQVDIVQSRMSLRCSRGKCNYVLAPSCAHSLLEKKVTIIFFLFSAPSLCPQSNVQVSTADNLWKQFRPDKMFSRECLHVQTRISLRCSRKKCSVSFSAPICVLNHLLLVSSADNLFKQLGPRADPAKLSCENGAHVKSRMSLRCWRGKFFFIFFKCTFLFFVSSFLSTIIYSVLLK